MSPEAVLELLHTAPAIHVYDSGTGAGLSVLSLLFDRASTCVLYPTNGITAFTEQLRENHISIHSKETVSFLKKALKAFKIKESEDTSANIGPDDLVILTSATPLPTPLAESIPAATRIVTVPELYVALFPGEVIAVTGTQGKSVTLQRLSDIATLSGLTSYTVSDHVECVHTLHLHDQWKKSHVLFLELSSRQVDRGLPRTPFVTVITAVRQDSTYPLRGQAKQREQVYQNFIRTTNTRKECFVVLNADAVPVEKVTQGTARTVLTYSVDTIPRRGTYLYGERLCSVEDGETKNVMSRQEILLTGQHTVSSCLAAMAVSRLLDVDWNTIRRALRDADPSPRRLEWIQAKRGVTYLDDTASRTPESTVAGLLTLPPGSVRLICGGNTCDMQYSELAQTIVAQGVKELAVLPGTVGETLRERIGTSIPVCTYDDITSCMTDLASRAESGDTILYSPAGQSADSSPYASEHLSRAYHLAIDSTVR